MRTLPFDLSCYNLGRTSYGLIHATFIDWNECRESLRGCYHHQGSGHRRDGILVAVSRRRMAAETRRLAAMVAALQDRMHLSANRRATVDSTQCKWCVYIDLPAYWRVPHRFDFLTAFLRPAKNPAYRTLDEVLGRGLYLKDTRPAVDRFIAGYRRMRRPSAPCRFLGWMETFRGKTDDTVKPLLFR